jgi:hypothetical protein
MAHAGRGRLKVYMGYAAGVGKTYRMLEEARELRQWFDDMDGFTTGRAQSLKEFTLTGEYQMTTFLLGRLEFRNDWSNQAFFQTSNGSSKSQPTALLGLIAFFGPKK